MGIFKKAKRAVQKKSNSKGQVDRPLIIALGALIAFGLAMIFSATMYESSLENALLTPFVRQAIYVALGVIVMCALSFFDYRKLNQYPVAYGLMFISVITLILVLFTGPVYNGARRWFEFGFITFQPSELAKFAALVWTGTFLTHNPKMKTNFAPFLVLGILPMVALCVLTVAEPSLSSAILIAICFMGPLIIGGCKKSYIGMIALGGIIGAAVLLIRTPWRLERLLVFTGQSNTTEYQILQSTMAIGAGGFWGKGLGNGTQKLLYLPEGHNDFIFANIAEELGFLGFVLIVVLYGYIAYRCFRIALATKDEFGFIYTTGFIILIVAQVLMNIMVSCNSMPATGVALPFISYGGSSFVILSAMVSPILNLSREIDLTQKSQSVERQPRRVQKRRVV